MEQCRQMERALKIQKITRGVTLMRLGLVRAQVAMVLIFCVLLGAQIASASVKITHWQQHSDYWVDVVASLARDFEKDNPGVKIDFNPMPYANYWEKLMISLEAGTGPDIMQIPYGVAREFYIQGHIQPVPASVMTKSEIENDFLAWTIEDFKFDDEYYGIPVDCQTMLLYVNRGMFDAAGIEVKQPESWDEVVEWAKKLTIRDSRNRVTQIGFDTSARRGIYKTIMMQWLYPNGLVDSENMKVNYDSPDGIAAWQFMSDLVYKHKAADPTFMGTGGNFEQQRSAIKLDGTWYRATLDNDYTEVDYVTLLVPPPAHKPEAKVNRAVKWGWFVASTCKNPEVAWEWIKYASNDDAQTYWQENKLGFLPSRKNVIYDARWHSDPNWQTILDAMDRSSSTDTIVGWADVNRIRGQLWEAVVNNTMPVDDAVRKFADEENLLLQEKKALFESALQ